MRVEAFSVMRTYSSSPSRRCAFSIGFALLLRRRLSELQRPPIGVDQVQLIGPPLAMVDDLGVSVLFHKCRHMLDRAPAGYVPVLALAEDAVQEPRGTKKPDMAAMQRRDGPASRNVLMRHQQRRRLFPCARLRQQVFQQVVGKAAIAQLRLARRRNEVGRACASLQIRKSQEAAM